MEERDFIIHLDHLYFLFLKQVKSYIDLARIIAVASQIAYAGKDCIIRAMLEGKFFLEMKKENEEEVGIVRIRAYSCQVIGETALFASDNLAIPLPKDTIQKIEVEMGEKLLLLWPNDQYSV